MSFDRVRRPIQVEHDLPVGGTTRMEANRAHVPGGQSAESSLASTDCPVRFRMSLPSSPFAECLPPIPGRRNRRRTNQKTPVCELGMFATPSTAARGTARESIQDVPNVESRCIELPHGGSNRVPVRQSDLMPKQDGRGGRRQCRETDDFEVQRRFIASCSSEHEPAIVRQHQCSGDARTIPANGDVSPAERRSMRERRRRRHPNDAVRSCGRFYRPSREPAGRMDLSVQGI